MSATVPFDELLDDELLKVAAPDTEAFPHLLHYPSFHVVDNFLAKVYEALKKVTLANLPTKTDFMDMVAKAYDTLIAPRIKPAALAALTKQLALAGASHLWDAIHAQLINPTPAPAPTPVPDPAPAPTPTPSGDTPESVVHEQG